MKSNAQWRGLVSLLFAGTLSIHAAPIRPAINTNFLINITNVPYNAVGNGVATNTMAIQNSINAAALGGTTNGLNGGTVEIPPGIFLSGPLTMKSSVNLQIDAGATLKMLPYGSYPGGTSPTDFISASALHDIEISGSGTIDGQGAPWWATNNATPGGISRPKAMFAPAGCNPVLVRDVTLQNPPNTHISFRSSSGNPCGNVTVSNITINTPDGTPNTDGIDMSATNVIIVNSYISDGDDHIAMGDSSAFVKDVVVTNCTFGTGHGVSIGSFTQGGLSNLFVVNCTWNGAGNGIRLKSERGRGGFMRDLNYQNLAMTNVSWPILIYSYYNYGVGTLSTATPFMAAADTAQTVTNTTPIWRDITFSNVTATTTAGRPAVMIWGLPEMLISNVTLRSVNINGAQTANASKNCEIYNATGIQFIDSPVTLSAGNNTFELYNAQITVTNSAPATNLITLDGLTTNGIGNSFFFFNTPAALKNTNVLDGGQIILGGGTLTVSNHLDLGALSNLDFTLGANSTKIAVVSNLTASGAINIHAGTGFTNGTYTLFTYGKNLIWGPPALGIFPAGYNGSLDTNTVGQVNLQVKTAPSLTPVNLSFQSGAGRLIISWPSDHIGWKLQIQTNTLVSGLGTNWTDVPGSKLVNSVTNIFGFASGTTFLRLVYP